MIRAVAAIFKRECRVHFFCLSNYLLAALLAAVSGLFFFSNVSSWSVAPHVSFDDMVSGPFFMNLCLITIAVSPLLSARAFTDEKRSGIFELLFTYPIRDIEIVIGKWIALLFQITFFLTLTSLAFGVIKVLGVDIHLKSIAVGYLGIWLIASFALSIGLFFSATSQSQALALVLTFIALLFFWTNGWLADLFFPRLGRLTSDFWIAYHMREFASGILDTNRLLFYGLGSMLMLILSMLALELRVWRR